MTDLLETGLDYLARWQQAHHSQQVVYTRGAASITLTATLGRSEFEQVGDAVGLVRYESRDFLIAAADLVLASGAVLPAEGDRITWAGQIYEVMAPGGAPAWRHCDPYNKRLRIHTKCVGTA